MNKPPTRKNIRLKGHDYSTVGYYFIIIYTKDKREPLGKIDVGTGSSRLQNTVMMLTEYGEIARR
ncbi:MAG: hypothetical protein FWC93_01485 [Defluviitaleaceae bacterium]|nr:hypothetical protein [Defluviitaleaceae bacterium]